MRNIIIATIFLLMTLYDTIYGQYIGYLVNDGSIQNTILNPSLPTKSSFSLNLSNIFVRAQNYGPSIGDVASKNAAGHFEFDQKKISQLPAYPYILVINADVHTIQLGFSIKSIQFNIGHAVRSSATIQYDKTMLDVILFGNGNYENKTASFNPYFQGQSYHQLYTAVQWKAKRFSIGIKPQILSGIVDFMTLSSDNSFYTGTSYQSLKLNTNFEFNSAGFLDYNNGKFITKSPKLNATNNLGWCIDVGIHFQAGEKTSIFAGMNDIGKIYWKEKVNNYRSKGSHTFAGFDLFDIQKINITDQLKDTLYQYLDIQKSNTAYNTSLNSVLNAGIKYKLDAQSSFTALWILPLKQKKLQSLSLAYNRKLGSFLQLGINYTATYRDYKNVGFNFGIKISKIYLNFTTQNALFWSAPLGAKQAGFYTGLLFQL